MGVQLISGDDVTLDDGLSDAGEERHSEPLLLNERFPGELWWYCNSGDDAHWFNLQLNKKKTSDI